MNQDYIKKLKLLGFEREKNSDSIYYFDNQDKLYATQSRWTTFVYYENNTYYISNNGDLVENFDAPNIDIYKVIEIIKNKIEKFGCYLDTSRIVKETTLETFEDDLKKFYNAVKVIDKIYRDL